ncbi:MAG: SGNH/GDSL hydrolase family protein [Mogibacterium diversum]|nr:SGNH/GDSL hydrolase family protein [Mogibacterium diversum]
MTDICVLGDSISKGIVFDDLKERYAVLNDNFISLLQREFGTKIKNFASFGATITKGLRIFEERYSSIKSHKYTLIEFGGNDCNFNWEQISVTPNAEHLAKTPLSEFKATYEDIIEKTMYAGSRPILLTLPPLERNRFFEWVSRDLNKDNIMKYMGGSTIFIERWHSSYNEMILELADEYGIQVFDIRKPFLELGDYSNYICIDGMHPNAAGHKLIAKYLREELAALE